jgi:hypothetical protein
METLYTSHEEDGSIAEIYSLLSSQPVFPSKLRWLTHELEAELDEVLPLPTLPELAALGVDTARYAARECHLHYHNGIIQISADDTVAAEVEMPFWKVVSAPKWANVDTDMKEAIDRRDGGDRDLAVYAARALESTIKIISDDKNLTNGKERGASNYIDNLMGAKLIDVWEMEALKHYFSKVRNPFSHGPGASPMLALTDQQTNWAIENAMIWIKSLIGRI